MSGRRRKQKKLLQERLMVARLSRLRKRKAFETIEKKSEEGTEVPRDVSAPQHTNDFVDSLKLIREQLKLQKTALVSKRDPNETPNVSPIAPGSTALNFLSTEESDYEGLAFNKSTIKTSTPMKPSRATKMTPLQSAIQPEIVPEVSFPPSAGGHTEAEATGAASYKRESDRRTTWSSPKSSVGSPRPKVKILVRKKNLEASSSKKPSDYPACPLAALYYD